MKPGSFVTMGTSRNLWLLTYLGFCCVADERESCVSQCVSMMTVTVVTPVWVSFRAVTGIPEKNMP